MTTKKYDPALLGELRTPSGVSVLDQEQRRVADDIVGRYPNSRSAVLPLLFLVQSIEGYVSEAGMREVADIIGLTPAEVLGTASFYTIFKKKPTGEYLISVCRNISCTHLGARKVIAALSDHLGIETGETTPDGKFTLEAAECLATCDGAPSLQVNYEDFYRIGPEEGIALVEALAAGEEVRSVRGEVVKPGRDVAYETATAALQVPGSAGDQDERTIGGETPRPDTAPGRRPPERGATAPRRKRAAKDKGND